MDWLLSNHDARPDHFLRLGAHTLVGIDKGQAFLLLGQDELCWTYQPGDLTVYGALWRAVATGRPVNLPDDDIAAAVADGVRRVQAIADDDLRDLARPYAEQAAAVGRLSLSWPRCAAHEPTVPPNNVEAFLDAVTARKHNLAVDFEALVSRAMKARRRSLHARPLGHAR